MIDFAAINASLLARSATFLQALFPSGKIRGNEFSLGNIQGEAGKSLSINLTTGIGSDFATGETWGDLIAVYAAHHRIGMGEAAKQLSNGHGERYLRAAAPVDRAPADQALPSCIHSTHGKPSAIYEYRDATGLLYCVARYEVSGGKQIVPWSRSGSAWIAKGVAKPRSIYGLDQVQANPAAKILIVEGEKCVDHLRRMGIARIPVTWSGGAKAWHTADWQPLADRDVLLFPDHDVPGREAMDALGQHLLSIAARVLIIDYADAELPEGWDIADTDWDAAALNAWAKERIKPVVPSETPEALLEEAAVTDSSERRVRRGKPRTKPNGQPPNGVQIESDGSVFVSWEALGLACDNRGCPYPNISNIKLILGAHPETTSRLWYDEFYHRVYSTFFTSEPAEWCDHHDTNLCAWIQSQLRIPKLGIDVIKRAVESVARAQPRHELRDWLLTLTWDQTPRLATLMADAYGAPQDDYTAAVGRCWLTSMVARAMLPGCQVDTIVVLEGAQGIRKSSSLAILGGKWYASLPDPFGSKDFLQSIDGVWLPEIPDMSSFRGRDIQHVKAIITTRCDRYRRSYGYHAETYPRQCVFVATANSSDWNQDPTGARRFWPIACTEVDIDYLTAQREQLFAEAVTLYQAGASWWDVPDTEARAEQEKRREEDPWEAVLEPWVSRVGRDIITTNEVFDGPIPVPLERRDMRLCKRLANVLRALGFDRGKRRLLGKVTNCFIRRGTTGYTGLQNSLIDQ